jgi:hypothetical protein
MRHRNSNSTNLPIKDLETGDNLKNPMVSPIPPLRQQRPAMSQVDLEISGKNNCKLLLV